MSLTDKELEAQRDKLTWFAQGQSQAMLWPPFHAASTLFSFLHFSFLFSYSPPLQCYQNLNVEKTVIQL